MDIVNNFLLWIHLTSLALGGVGAFGLPVIGMMMPTATPEMRPTLFKIAHRLSTVSRAGLGLLLVTGPLLVWLKYGGAGFTNWFWAKMLFVLILLGLVIFAGINAKRAEAGDMAAAKRAPMIGMAATLSLLAVILCAVFAFS